MNLQEDKTKNRLQNGKFMALLEGALPPKTHPNYQHWRDYAISGIDRGRETVELISSLTDVRGARVLDFGYGTGGYTAAFAEAGADVTAIDCDAKQLALAKALAEDLGVGADFRVDAEYGGSLEEGVFDIIICRDVIEHVDSFERLAASHSRLLKSGGLLYLLAPNRFYLGFIPKDPHYGLAGVSLMGYRWGEYYVTKIRKQVDSYDVNRLLGWYEVRRIYRESGIELTYHSPGGLVDRLQQKNLSTPSRWTIPAISVSMLARFTLFFLRESWVFIGRKRS